MLTKNDIEKIAKDYLLKNEYPICGLGHVKFPEDRCDPEEIEYFKKNNISSVSFMSKHLGDPVLSGAIQAASASLANLIVPDPTLSLSAGNASASSAATPVASNGPSLPTLREAAHYFVVGSSAAVMHAYGNKLLYNREVDLSQAVIQGLNTMLRNMASSYAQQQIAEAERLKLEQEMERQREEEIALKVKEEAERREQGRREAAENRWQEEEDWDEYADLSEPGAFASKSSPTFTPGRDGGISGQSASSSYSSTPLQPEQASALDWMKMAWRAAKGERSPEVIRWQENNREAAPMIASFTDGVEQSTAHKSAKAFVRGAASSIKGKFVFVGKEAARFSSGEKTKTKEFVEGATAAGAAVKGKYDRVLSGEDELLSVEFFRFMDKYINEDITRFRNGEQTKTSAGVLRGFDSLSRVSAEDIFGTLGSFAGDTVFFSGAAKVISRLGKIKVGGKKSTAPRKDVGAKESFESKSGYKKDDSSGSSEYKTSNGQANSSQAEKLARELERESCQSMFTPDGKLSQGAIENSRILMDVSDFDPRSQVYKILSKIDKPENWAKYRTQKFSTSRPSIDITKSSRNLKAEVHFYKNKVTGEVYYDIDFKVKLDVPGNTHYLVEEFLQSLPSNWRPKP